MGVKAVNVIGEALTTLGIDVPDAVVVDNTAVGAVESDDGTSDH